MLAMSLERHYTVKEVARLLSMGERTIWNWIKDGKLKAVKIGGAVRIPVSALAALGLVVKDETDNDATNTD